MSIPANALTHWEQRANVKRGLLYTLALCIAILVALLVAFVVWGLIAADIGYARGVEVERERHANTPTQAPANCRELARICANQEIDRFKKFGRKPT